MHSPEKSRNSICSTDNGSSSHGHEHSPLSQVVSNQSDIFSSTKQKEVDSPVMLSTSDAGSSPAPQTSAVPLTPKRASKLSAAAAVHLDTLLVTGQRKAWRFDPNDTVEAVRQHIYENWPESWPQKPDSAAYLRLLHLGHILDNPDTTLISRGCKAGATTVVHIIIRSVLPPEPTKVEQETPVKTEVRAVQRSHQDDVSPGCSCVIC